MLTLEDISHHITSVRVYNMASVMVPCNAAGSICMILYEYNVVSGQQINHMVRPIISLSILQMV